MKGIRLLASTLTVCAAALPAIHASDFTGVYARIDKVVLEPATETPERIQIWGVFSIATNDNPNDYQAPARGYLYYRVAANPEAARNEWKDLKQAAGSGEIVSFGSRGRTGRLRTANDKPENPDPYGVNVGVTKVRGRTDYAPIRALLDFKN
jgi:hypothetical protein